MLVYLKGKQVGKPPFIRTDSVIFVVFSLEHNLYPMTQIPHYFFPKYSREFNFFIKRKRNPNTILKIKKIFFFFFFLVEKIKRRKNQRERQRNFTETMAGIGGAEHGGC